MCIYCGPVTPIAQARYSMSMIKNLFTVLLLILIGLGLFAVYGLYQLDLTIENKIRTIGTSTTQTPVTLSEAKISLRNGEGQLSNLIITNPDGFNSPYAFAIDNIELEIDPKSVMQQVIVVRNITIDGAKLIAEEKGYRNLNLYQLHQNIMQSTPQSPDISEKRFMVEQITFANNQLRLVTEKFGEKDLDLASFTINNIGDKTQGLTPNQLAPALVTPVIAKATETVKQALIGLEGSHGADALKKMAEQRLELEQGG